MAPTVALMRACLKGSVRSGSRSGRRAPERGASDRQGRRTPRCQACPRSLKDFQRETVEHVFARMYKGRHPARRFLLADEVGLGKTLVAKGLIAKAVDKMWDDVDRIDVVYICSNGDIARQNVRRLNVSPGDEFALASRITLLPTQIHDLRSRRLNFVSFTPRTSFDTRGGGGIASERALLYWMLRSSGDSATRPGRRTCCKAGLTRRTSVAASGRSTTHGSTTS